MLLSLLRIRVLRFLVLALSIVLISMTRATTQTADKPFVKPDLPAAKFVPGDLLVRFRSEVSANEANRLEARSQVVGRSVKMSIESLGTEEVLPGLRNVRVASEDMTSVLEMLRAREDVLYAEPNFIRYRAATPNDSLYGDLWGLHTEGFVSGIFVDGIAGSSIHAEQAWDITTGSRDVVVGVVDGGIDVSHPDLRANIWNNQGEIAGNNIDDDGNGYIDDVNGFDFFRNHGTVFDFNPDYDKHATHVAGTIGAVGNNGEGVVGVNWQVSMMSLKVFGPENEAPYPSSVRVLVRAYVYAKKMRDLWVSSGGTKGANIRVLNNSLGGYGRSQAELEAIEALNESGILFVAAAGNYTRNNDVFPFYPAGYESKNVISVAATYFGDKLADFTNVGARSVTLSAPGSHIESTTPYNTYSYFDGTSMASPHVAGVAALVCAAHPDISVARLRAALIYNGDLIESQKYQSLTGRRLNAFNALNAAAENDETPPAPIRDFRIVAQKGRSVTLGWTAPGDDGNTGTVSLYDIKYSTYDLSSSEQFDQSTTISPTAIPYPSTAGTLESATVEVPFSETGGFIGLQATDNMGNTNQVAVVPVSVPDTAANLYDVSESTPEPVSSGGTRVQFFLNPDDACSFDYPLPFDFPFYGRDFRNVSISSNGALYFSGPPKFLLPPMTGSGAMIDAFSSVRALQTNAMIAGMWDDLIITGIYAVTPDPNRIIFRWEGNTYDSKFDDNTSRGSLPISFEIELRRNGTIQIRYGDGNQKMLPVVGISGGSPNSYVVTSHTSENEFKNLGNAKTLAFSPHFAYVSGGADLKITAIAKTLNTGLLPQGVVPGQILQYTIAITDLGPDAADNVVLTALLPKGTSFDGCQEVECSGPPPGTDGGTVTINYGTVGQLYNNRNTSVTMRVKVGNVPVGSTIATSFSASSSTSDPDLSNNSAIETTLVVGFSTFGNVVSAVCERTYSMALTRDGAIWFWGLSFGSPDGSGNWTTPKQVHGLTNIIAIAGGREHALALRSDGTVWSWGTNAQGQLGRIAGPTSHAFPPTQIPGLSGIRMIAAAGEVSFALDGNDSIWAWGDNSSGQLGDGTKISRMAPVHLTGISDVREISTGDRTAFAIKKDGTLWGWGDNSLGQLGIGDSSIVSSVPVQVHGIANVRGVSAAYIHVVAVKDDGTVWTWGYGPSGEFGRPYGTEPLSAVPLQVPGMSDVTAVAAGSTSSMALKSDRTVWTWGDGQYSPVQVAGLANVSSIRAQANDFVAILPDGNLRIWGFNGYGTLGDGTITGSSTPVQPKVLEVAYPPVLSPGDSTFVFPRNVIVTCETEGAIIHYTTNGVDPTEADPVVNSGGQIRVDHSMVVKTRAWKSGSAPGKVTSAAYTVVATGNLIDEPWSFVRQHYFDFMSREPDQGGQDYWTGRLTQCGLDILCVNRRRIEISNAFFYELEYQQTGAYVFRLLRAAYGNNQPFANPDSGYQIEAKKVPSFAVFSADRAKVVGGTNLALSQLEFATTLVTRPEFTAKYPATLDGPQFVDAVLLNLNSDMGVDLKSERAALNGLYGSGGRAAVMYRLADDNVTNPINNRSFIDEEYNRAFVATQYFGYLRRDPDMSGFLFWLGQLSGAPLRDVSKQHAMVCSFVTSSEYQHRFGSVESHSNAECPQ